MPQTKLGVKTHLSRHPHDVSAGYTLSATTGQIRPLFFDVLGPGDTIYYQTHAMARLNDILTAFLGEIDIHVDYHFVPLQMLFTPFGQVFAQTDDLISSMFNQTTKTDKFPLLSAGSFELPNYQISPEGECYGKEKARLLGDLDCNPLYVFNPTQTEADGFERPSGAIDASACCMPNISPWLFAAYQAIYQKFYRNDDIERLKISSYNFDQYFGSSAFSSDSMTKLRYCQRPNDYFTNNRVSPLSSAVNTLGNTNTYTGGLSDILVKVNDYLGFGPKEYTYNQREESDTAPSSNPEELFSTGTTDSYNTTLGQSVTFSPTAANIRALFAVDKFVRTYGRANKTYDDQILAHFGVKVPHDIKHDATRLASYRMVLQADPLYSMANTLDQDASNGSALGQLGGQANNTLNTGSEKFTAPVHGVFMAVMYAVTKPRYFGTFSKLNFLDSRLRFPIPEFDKLGAQPLYTLECSPDYITDGLTTETSGASAWERVCWQNRYQEFKKKYNRTSLYFVGENNFGMQGTNPFSPWVLSRQPLGGASAGFGYSTLVEKPNSLNGVMAVTFDSAWHAADYYVSPQTMFATDPIVFDYFCQAKKVSWMSETGEPDL